VRIFTSFRVSSRSACGFFSVMMLAMCLSCEMTPPLSLTEEQVCSPGKG
jgi:hypothetical protein